MVVLSNAPGIASPLAIGRIEVLIKFPFGSSSSSSLGRRPFPKSICVIMYVSATALLASVSANVACAVSKYFFQNKPMGSLGSVESSGSVVFLDRGGLGGFGGFGLVATLCKRASFIDGANSDSVSKVS